MIAIVNVSPPGTHPGDFHTYELKINRRVITRFQHRRLDGLAQCLRAAADAVEESRAMEVQELMLWLRSYSEASAISQNLKSKEPT